VTTPATPGINLTSPAQTTRAQAVAAYVSQLDSAYGTEISQSYQGYANKHPGETAYQALQNWANTLAASLGPGLAKTIQGFANDAGTGQAQIAKGTVLGAEQITKDLTAPSWSLILGGISGWFFRGLKVVFGGILMIVGISKLLNVDNKIVQLASKIPVVPV
jgi:hypothetical protein